MAEFGQEIKKLGFGLMRLPMNGAEVDLETTQKMVDAFIAAGFTYFDTAYGYIGGKSEAAAKRVLVEKYPRESFQLATKLPAWAGCKTPEDARNMFYTSLERTGAGYFDFYLLHAMSSKNKQIFEDLHVWEFAAELKAKDLVKHVGFSFHDSAEELEKLLTEHPEAEFVQLQINYDDWESEGVQSHKCYEVARAHAKPVIIMEPVKGGNLSALPAPVAEILKAADPNASLSSWALRFAASLPGLVTVLSGMSTPEQMADNLATMTDFRPLSPTEREVLDRAKAALDALPRIPCTGCRYCVAGCPQKIAIPDIFHAANLVQVYNNLPGAKGHYGYVTKEGGKASACVACGQCESVCPQHIGIIGELEKTAKLFDGE